MSEEPRTMTITVPENVVELLQLVTGDVNWSKVATSAFIEVLTRRLKWQSMDNMARIDELGVQLMRLTRMVDDMRNDWAEYMARAERQEDLESRAADPADKEPSSQNPTAMIVVKDSDWREQQGKAQGQ